MATAEFSKFAGILSAALSQHHLSGFETAQLEFKIQKKRGNVYIHITDLLCCTFEADRMVQGNYTPITINLIKIRVRIQYIV